MRFKAKKNVRQRGSKTHGCGSMKKRRGAGNRGGRGRSGSGKRGDQKKPCYWKDKQAKGFTSKSRNHDAQINIKDIENKLGCWLKQGRISKKGEIYEIDMKTLGYTKVLAAGKAASKMHIFVDSCSERAVVKIRAAGGKIVLSGLKQETRHEDSEKTEV